MRVLSRLPISLSVGVVSVNPVNECSIAGLLVKAGQAMYEYKKRKWPSAFVANAHCEEHFALGGQAWKTEISKGVTNESPDCRR